MHIHVDDVCNGVQVGRGVRHLIGVMVVWLTGSSCPQWVGGGGS